MVKYDAQIVPLLKILVNQIFKQLREGPAVTISYFHSQCIDSASTLFPAHSLIAWRTELEITIMIHLLHHQLEET